MNHNGHSKALTHRGTHARYADARTGQRGGALTAIGLDMFGVKAEAEFDRTSSKTVTQRMRTGINRLRESEDIRRARKLSREGLSGLADLLQKVNIEQYTNAADVSSCKEAWDDSVEASYRGVNRTKIDQYIFKKLVLSNYDKHASTDKSHSKSNSEEEYSLVDELSEEIIELVDERRASRVFWESLFQVPVGQDEDGKRRRILQSLGARELRATFKKGSPITYVDASCCYYKSRETWIGSNKTLVSENDWSLPVGTKPRNIKKPNEILNDSNMPTGKYVSKLLLSLPVPIRDIVVDVVTSVASAGWKLNGSIYNSLADQIRDELKVTLEIKGMREWEAPSRAIVGMCLIITSFEQGSITFKEANRFLQELSRQVFVCYIRETARDIIRKKGSFLKLTDLEKQAEVLSDIVGSRLTKIPRNMYESASELREFGCTLPSLLDGTNDKLVDVEGGTKVLYRNMEYDVCFIFENVANIADARELCSTCLILMRGGGVQLFITECQEEAQRRQILAPPPSSETFVYSETRAAMSVKLKRGEVSNVVHASNIDHMRRGFLAALDAKEKRGYRAMVLEGGGLFVIEYEGSVRHAWVNIGSGIPWLITGGGQRSKDLGAQQNSVMLVWRDFVLPILSSISEVRISALIDQIGKGRVEQLFPNLVFEVAASLLGRGRLLVTAPELYGYPFDAINLCRKKETYEDYLRTRKEKDSQLKGIPTLVMDNPIRLNIHGTRVKDTLRCGDSLEYVVEGYWKGDTQSICCIRKDAAFHGSVSRPRTFVGQPEIVEALFE